ncbi:hypothetical protein JCM8115_005499 [Rhodotorula mucilaginosa]
MCGEISLFFNLRRCRPSPVGGVSGAKNGLVVTGVGSLLVKLVSGRIVVIHQALLVPGIAANLISSSQLYDNHGVTTTFGQGATLSRNGVVIATGTRLRKHLYQLDGELIAPSTAKELLELVHTDVLSINVPSYGGRRYVVTFVDDHSRMLWVEALARKSDVFGAFQRFKAAAENESGKHIQRLRSDNGGEYTSHEFRDFLAEHGIHHEMPPPYSPQANGVAERINRTIVEGLISLLNQAQAPKALWAEALLAFVFVKNRSPHAALAGGVPLAVWRGKPVRVDMLRVWGCRAYHTVTNGRAKLNDKAVPLVFIGYDGDMAAYRLFDPATRKTVRSRDARFVEDEFPFAAATPSTAQSLPQPMPAPDDLIILASSQAPSAANDATPQTPARAPPVVPRPPVRAAQAREVVVTPPSSTAPAPLRRLRPSLFSLTRSPVTSSTSSVTTPSGPHLPKSRLSTRPPVKTSLPRTSNFRFRRPTLATTAKRCATQTPSAGASASTTSSRPSKTSTTSSTPSTAAVPPDAKILGARFVYRRKKDQNGQVTGHKVRLVAQGFTQRPYVDFRETFAPVVKFTSIRVLLALAARHRLHVHQADIDMAYLHGALEEELYMRVPEGIDDSEYAGKVLKLDHALYGLKQAGRVWNHRIHATLEGLGYQRTKSDACIYVRSEGGHTHYIALYVDDLLFVSPDLDEIQRIKDGLKRQYGIKDLGEAKFILGIQVHRRSNGGIFLSQRAYLEDVLLRLGYADGRTAPTPMQPNLQLAVAPEDHQPTPAFRSRYLQAVGSLIHAARPDNSHWAAVIRVLAYIKGTLDFGLEFQPDDSPLAGFEAYSDSDWGACPSTSRSTMGYTFVLASGAVSWSSKLQPRVTASSTEAEYLGLSHASKEAIHLSQLLSELAQGSGRPIELFGDNQGANALSRDPQFHNRTRHLRLTEHFVREQVQQGDITVTYIPTARMVADVMTKSLPLPGFIQHRVALGIRPFRARGGVAADALPPG